MKYFLGIALNKKMGTKLHVTSSSTVGVGIRPTPKPTRNCLSKAVSQCAFWCKRKGPTFKWPGPACVRTYNKNPTFHLNFNQKQKWVQSGCFKNRHLLLLYLVGGGITNGKIFLIRFIRKKTVWLIARFKQ